GGDALGPRRARGALQSPHPAAAADGARGARPRAGRPDALPALGNDHARRVGGGGGPFPIPAEEGRTVGRRADLPRAKAALLGSGFRSARPPARARVSRTLPG